jgi:hypothetical protein
MPVVRTPVKKAAVIGCVAANPTVDLFDFMASPLRWSPGGKIEKIDLVSQQACNRTKSG